MSSCMLSKLGTRPRARRQRELEILVRAWGLDIFRCCDEEHDDRSRNVSALHDGLCEIFERIV